MRRACGHVRVNAYQSFSHGTLTSPSIIAQRPLSSNASLPLSSLSSTSSLWRVRSSRNNELNINGRRTSTHSRYDVGVGMTSIQLWSGVTRAAGVTTMFKRDKSCGIVGLPNGWAFFCCVPSLTTSMQSCIDPIVYMYV
jgi:hypothetical protein